jgi:hypothetical protein
MEHQMNKIIEKKLIMKKTNNHNARTKKISKDNLKLQLKNRFQQRKKIDLPIDITQHINSFLKFQKIQMREGKA